MNKQKNTTFKQNLTEDSKPEFVGQIVDIFEDYLEAKNISLVNQEREDAIDEGEIDEEEAAILYGDSYDMIGSEIEFAIDQYSLYDSPVVDKSAMADITKAIIEGFKDAVKDGEAEDVPDADLDELSEKVKDVFISWELFSEN